MATKTKFAVFDIDGTLIRWQLYHALVDRLAKKNLLGKGADKELQQARMKWKRREHPEAFREYEGAMIQIYEAAFDQLNTKDFDTTVKEVIKQYSDQTYVYTRDLIAKLKKQGYLLLAISGSHQELVELIAKQYGFDDWVGTNYERRDGRFSGKVFVASQHKKQVLESFIKKHDLSLKASLAIGDGGSDADMLAMVDQPIAFNPDQKLYQLAKQKGWKIVIERKNVTYQLEASDGKYLLA
jgi:HAD superfamily hydrolase (TIGR01490 family)